MKIKIFMTTGSNSTERALLSAFAQGVRLYLEQQHGFETVNQNYLRTGRWINCELEDWCELVYDDAYSECDVAVMFGSWKPRDKGSHVTRTSVAQNAKKFIVIETPLINRRTSDPNDHWRIGVNGFLNGSAYWPDLPDYVADARLSRWGVEWSGWHNNEQGHIVVALQLAGDASLRGIDINEWAFNTVIDLRKHTERPITIRNHPFCAQRAFADHDTLLAKLMSHGVKDLTFSDGYLRTWAQDLNDAYCTVTYTSGLAVDSVLAGIPTVACDQGNFAWPISAHFADEINALPKPDSAIMMQWLRQLAGCQWSTDEMRNSTAWHGLLPVLEALK